MIADSLAQLKTLRTMTRRCETVNINSKLVKQAAIDAGSEYFKRHRQEAVGILQDERALAALDDDWQRLIRLAHGNNAKDTYLKLLLRLQKATTELTVSSHAIAVAPDPAKASKLTHTEAEQILLQTLDSFLPSAASSYRQGLQDLNSLQSRFSYKGTACEFREALRGTLDHFAPDNDVTRQDWFKQEPNCSGPTMKQKVRFILSSRGKNQTKRTLPEKSAELIDNLCGDIARAAYNRASLSTHLETTREEIVQIKRYLDAVLFEVLEIGTRE